MNGKKNIKNNPIFYDILYTNSQTLKALASNWFSVETLVLFYFFNISKSFLTSPSCIETSFFLAFLPIVSSKSLIIVFKTTGELLPKLYIRCL